MRPQYLHCYLLRPGMSKIGKLRARQRAGLEYPTRHDTAIGQNVKRVRAKQNNPP
jgi:hypothetical protein